MINSESETYIYLIGYRHFLAFFIKFHLKPFKLFLILEGTLLSFLILALNLPHLIVRTDNVHLFLLQFFQLFIAHLPSYLNNFFDSHL